MPHIRTILVGVEATSTEKFLLLFFLLNFLFLGWDLILIFYSFWFFSFGCQFYFLDHGGSWNQMAQFCENMSLHDSVWMLMCLYVFQELLSIVCPQLATTIDLLSGDSLSCFILVAETVDGFCYFFHLMVVVLLNQVNSSCKLLLAQLDLMKEGLEMGKEMLFILGSTVEEFGDVLS